MSNDFHHRTGSGDRSNTLLFIFFSGQDQPRPLSAAGRWKGWVPIFLAIAVFLTWRTWDGPANLLPLIPMSAGTIALWTNNAGIIRLANMFICSPTWIIYDILTGAYSAIANEVVVIGSVILSIYRYGMKELLDPESEFQKGGSKS